ncbi:MAG: MerR family transcriptional regulator [Caulobacter sp.]|jgi:DNA-binding transcriptional MerR regulator|nr:MerR family transcriptional regulator [Caulobacter sp.]
MAKGPHAFRTISEAADELGVAQHVLRFWETKFSFIRPMKRAGGRRFYRPQDILVLRGVRALLHDEGYTIKGVQKLHKDHGLKRLVASGDGDFITADDDIEPMAMPGGDEARRDGEPQISLDGREALAATLAELEEIKARLDALLAPRN